MKTFLALLALAIVSQAQITPGSQQTYTNNAVQFQSKPVFDVRDYPAADVCASINAAITAMPATGGTVLVPGGNYTACSATITLNKPGVILRGMGSGSPLSGNTGATTINMASGITGIDITGAKAGVEDLFLMSASAGAGTDDGIRVRAGSVTLRRVSTKHFGRNGIRVDGGNVGGSADLWHFEDTQTDNNYGDGMRWASPCTDNNLGTGIQLDSSNNAGWGYYIDCGNGNQFMTTHATQNVLGGIYVAAAYQTFLNCYIEGGVGSSFVIDNTRSIVGVHVVFQAFGQPTTITNAVSTANGNSFDYTNTDGWPVKTPFYLSGFPGSAGNKYYLWDVNSFAPGDLGLYDATQNEWLFHYNTSSKFTFNNRLTTTSTGTLPGFNVGGVSGDPSTLINGDMWYDSVANKFRCEENGAPTNCIGVSSGGTVTHTAGPLTALKMMIGNGAADATIDASTTSDGAGNIVLTSIQTAGANGGLAGVEGNGSGLTPAVGQDLLYADSTSHCWHQSLNNVDSGCALVSKGPGTGSVLGFPAVNSTIQADQTSWNIAFTNATATAGSHGGLGILVQDNGDAYLEEVVTPFSNNLSSIGFLQNADLALTGNGSNGDSGVVGFTILHGATAKFVLQNTSSVVTGSPILQFTGKTSGSGSISVASVAGTPNNILLPTATGSANGILKTDGANPQQTSWTLAPALTTLSLTSQFTSTLATGTAPLVITSTTPVANLTTVPTTYNHSGTQQTATHLVRDRCTLGTDCSVTLSGSAVYTSSSTYDCVAIDRTGANAIQFAPSSGSAFALTGTGTDTISYLCVGN